MKSTDSVSRDILHRANSVSYLPPVQNNSLAEIYSSQNDEELIALASDADALVDEARPVLAGELLRRNIAVAKPSTTERSTPQKDSQVINHLNHGYTIEVQPTMVGTGSILRARLD